MLRFFRKIRQSLFQEKKLARYLMYAIGEVALVIIGIMIAVWLNNLNEAKNQDKKIQSILQEVREELTSTIEASNAVIEHYRQKDSLIYLVMHNELTKEDYLDPKNVALTYINTTYIPFAMQDDGFNSLMLKSDVLANKYLPLLKRLKELFINTKDGLDYSYDEIDKISLAIIDHRLENYDFSIEWYFNDDLNSEMLEYFLNDINHKKGIYRYAGMALSNFMPRVMTARSEAINMVREIDALLGESSTHSFDVDFSDYQHWNGKYHFEGDTVDIDINESGFKMINNGDTTEIYPLSSDKFHVDSPAFLRFQKDENGETEGYTVRLMNYRFFYQKIKAND